MSEICLTCSSVTRVEKPVDLLARRCHNTDTCTYSKTNPLRTQGYTSHESQ